MIQEVESVIIGGNRLGRTLGFPTANMDVADRGDLENGVYESEIDIDGQTYRAMSNVGTRPSVDGSRRLLETHIFNFRGDLYGRCLCVRLLRKIRNEQKFSSIEELRAQLECDKMEIYGE
ncbi:MAG: riboflavin kinase [Alistipes sp.]|jgi:riboflavin kinase/FMN adenylyltransferase|nr:riboflavin kinase [Alistipes sp.]